MVILVSSRFENAGIGAKRRYFGNFFIMVRVHKKQNSYKWGKSNDCSTCPFRNYSRCYRVLCVGMNLCNEWNRIVCFGLCGRICTRHAKIIHFKILLDFEN